MSSKKVYCNKCNTGFLEVTARKTGGICLKCKKGDSESDTLEKVEFSIRLALAIGFGIGFSVMGFTLGSTIWTGVGFFLALVAFPIGFIYGFFSSEINFFIRSIVSNILNH